MRKENDYGTIYKVVEMRTRTIYKFRSCELEIVSELECIHLLTSFFESKNLIKGLGDFDYRKFFDDLHEVYSKYFDFKKHLNPKKKSSFSFCYFPLI